MTRTFQNKTTFVSKLLIYDINSIQEVMLIVYKGYAYYGFKSNFYNIFTKNINAFKTRETIKKRKVKKNFFYI